LLEDKKGGNSNENERIAVSKACLQLLAGQSVAVIGDREFVGTCSHKSLKGL